MSLDQIIKDINKKHKAEIINKGVVYQDIERIPFSSPRMNYMTYGGLPIGRMVELSGEQSSGKSTCALDIIKNAQIKYPDKQCVFIDVERTFDSRWAVTNGVDVDSLILVTPDEQTAEQLFEISKALIESSEVSVCVLDSIGSLVSAQAYDKTLEENTYGGVSKPLTLFANVIIPICARTGCLFIAINQVREDMNSRYGGLITPGGKAFKHACSVRMEFRKSTYVDQDGKEVTQSAENPAGHYTKVNLIKSKVCRIDRKVGTFLLNYMDGIDYISDIIDLCVSKDIIVKAGAWYRFTHDGEEISVQGKRELKKLLKENTEMCNTFNDLLQDYIMDV